MANSTTRPLRVPFAYNVPAGYVRYNRASDFPSLEEAENEALLLREVLGYSPVLVLCSGHIGPGHPTQEWEQHCTPEVLADRLGGNSWQVYAEDASPE